MTGKRWRLTALLAVLLLAGIVWRLWWVSEDLLSFVVAVIVLFLLLLLWALDVEEAPQCGRELPHPAVNYASHATHHCRLEPGHRERRCECRCGLVSYPPKRSRGAGSLQVVLDSARGLA